MTKGPSFTVGIEEEYFLVDPETRDLAVSPPPALLEACQARAPDRVTNEFLQSQIEVGTRVCADMTEAAEDLRALRRCIVEEADRHGLAVIAASTHPFSHWNEQRHVDKARYNDLARDLKTVARRLMICGMHVHVGIDDDELRIDLMNQVRYFIPHLLVLTTSSPFWQGEDTGLNAYRLSVFNELPRTGVPEMFDSHGEYTRHVEMLVGAGLIEDATKIWWDVRPSCRFPTLEMRITDICTDIDDAICVAALYQGLLSMLYRLRRNNQRWRAYAGMLVEENKWRAQRYGFEEGLVDFGLGKVVPYGTLLDEILGLVGPDLEALKSLDHAAHAREILTRGTSSHRQRDIHARALEAGASQEEAHRQVVDWLIERTRAGL